MLEAKQEGEQIGIEKGIEILILDYVDPNRHPATNIGRYAIVIEIGDI